MAVILAVDDKFNEALVMKGMPLASLLHEYSSC